MLEATQWKDNAFVSLTYDECSLPLLSSGLATLEPKHLQDWLKRLRKVTAEKLPDVNVNGAPAERRLRFYAAGEYGDETQRPHYHVALFNFPTCARGRTRRKIGSGRPVWRGCCLSCELVGETWGHGDVDLGMLETSSAQYVCGYTTKKMTSGQDARLFGRYPEFSRKSLRPGIGGEAMHELASELMRLGLDRTQPDVPSALRHGARELPLGRYLTRRLRKLVGKDEKTPQAIKDQLQAELQPVRKAAFDASKSFASALVEARKGQSATFHARQKIYKGRKSL